ncbi:MAG: ABC transporter substrate-binding protein [Oscillospiraceae bacterium]|nr:ABC transporter substrate-binding protein [Oscillospiraceae bacterium]
MKKIFALLLAGIMIVALVGCGSSSREVVQLTFATQDVEAILNAAGIYLPDVSETSAAGTTVKWCAWYDDIQNYSEDEIINSGYWTFQEKYGCTVEWIEVTWDTRFDEIANYVLASNSPDFYPGHDGIFPMMCMKGVFMPVDDYIDYSDPLWADVKDYADSYYTIKGLHYTMIYDVTFGNVCAYNRRVVSEYGYDDPAELYYNDEWTWDVFYDMCTDFTDADEDRYALDGWGYGEAIMRSCGELVVVYNTETMEFESNIDAPAIERAASLMYDLAKNDCQYPVWNNGWSIRNSVDGGGMKEGLCLFYIGGTYMFTGPVDSISSVWGDLDELMFVPLPRDDDGDGVYYAETTPSAYALVQGAQNPEGVALLASCMRFKVLDPTVVNIDRQQLENTYLWTQDMLDMWDECYDLANNGSKVIVSYYEGLGDKLNNVVSALEGFGEAEDPTTWAQMKETYSEQIDYYVNQLNETIASYDPYSLNE